MCLPCLVPRRLSLDVNLHAKEGGKEKTGETALRSLASISFPWSLSLCHQSLAFCACLCSRPGVVQAGLRQAMVTFAKFEFRNESLKRKFSLIIFVYSLTTEYSKRE